MIIVYLAMAFLLATLLCRFATVMNPRLQCDCGLRHRAVPRRHGRNALLLVSAIVQTACAVCYIIAWHTAYLGIFVMLAASVLDWWCWWVHSKNSRKKLMDKVLGVVQVTVAGLKVKPVPA